MKLFYLCRTGHHTSLIAAARHLGILSGKPVNIRGIYSIPGYDQIDFRDIGQPYYAGIDHLGNKIYTIGVWREGQVMSRAVHDLISIMGEEPGEWEVIDTSSFVSGWTALGLKMKRIHLDGLARVLFYLGAGREMAAMSNAPTGRPT